MYGHDSERTSERLDQQRYVSGVDRTTDVAGAEDDRRATWLAQAVLRGERDETDVRWELAAMLLESRVVERPLRQYRNDNSQVFRDLEAALDKLLTDKVVGIGVQRALSLHLLAAGASLRGWGRQFLSPIAVARVHKKISLNYRDIPVPFGSVPTDDRGYQRVGVLDIAERAEPEVDGDLAAREAAEAAIASYAGRARNLRTKAKVHLNAETLCAFYDLPRPPRLVDETARRHLIDSWAADPAVATGGWSYDEGVELDAQGPGLPDRFVMRLLDEVVEVWPGWEPAHMAKLYTLHPLVRETLALASVTPIPPPQHRAIEAVAADLVGVIGSRRAAMRLVTTWSATLAELDRSEFSPTGAPQVKTVDQRRADTEAWASEVSRLLARTHRIGRSEQQVAAHLARLLDHAEERLAA